MRRDAAERDSPISPYTHGMGLISASAAILVTAIGSRSEGKLFPDTKKNHWAYEAMVRCKAEGLLASPNPLHGNYPAARATFAWCANAAYKKLLWAADHLALGVDQVNSKIAVFSRPWELDSYSFYPPDQAEVKGLTAALQDLLDEAQGWDTYRVDIRDLKRLVKEFAPEMTAQSIDPKAVTRGLADLDKRLSRIVVPKRE